jgi:hypothetical protein
MSGYRTHNSIAEGLAALLKGTRRMNRGAAWGLMIIGALLAFEVFNFSTTQFALADVLGDLTFSGLRWATILAIAFCGIDFAGIARIFTPQQGRDEPAEVWYLFGAWLLAAGFNATLTWWGVSVAIVNHQSAGVGAVVSGATMTKVVPIFVAVMVWLIRVLIIGTFSLSGDNLFSTARPGAYTNPRPAQQSRPVATPALRPASSLPRPASQSTYRPAPKPAAQSSYNRAEPQYTNLTFGASAERGEGHNREQ